MVNGEVMPLSKFSENYGEAADTLLVYNTIFNALGRHKDLINSKTTFFGMECGKIPRKWFYGHIQNKDTESLKEAWCTDYGIEKMTQMYG